MPIPTKFFRWWIDYRGRLLLAAIALLLVPIGGLVLWPAPGPTLLPDALLCDQNMPLAAIQQNSRQFTNLKASETLARTAMLIDALQADKRAQTLDMQYRPSIELAKAMTFLEKCESSGPKRLEVTVIRRFPPSIGAAIVTARVRGQFMTLLTESALID